MPATPVHALPYPALTDPADVPADMQRLANALDTQLLPADTVDPAATRLIANKLIAADAQPAWRVLGSGLFEWGPGGAAAPDTSMGRAAAGVLNVNGALLTTGLLSPTDDTGASFKGIAFGTAQDTRLYRPSAAQLRTNASITADGSLAAGAGTLYLGAETSIYRKAGNVVGTIGSFVSEGALTGWGFYTLATGEAQARAYLRNDGQLLFGGGAAPQDTNLYRSAAAALRTDGSFWAGAGLVGQVAATGNAALRTVVGGEGDFRFFIAGDGAHWWGAGVAGQDTNLFRDAANYLKTKGHFRTGGELRVASDVILNENDTGRVYFGSALDTTLYRGAATKLVASGLQVSPGWRVGRVEADGSKYAGSGWTSQKLGTGNYRITFTAPIPTDYLLISVTRFGSGGGEGVCTPNVYNAGNPTTSFDVSFNDRTGNPADSRFYFIAMPYW